jgi:hypothetical protein
MTGVERTATVSATAAAHAIVRHRPARRRSGHNHAPLVLRTSIRPSGKPAAKLFRACGRASKRRKTQVPRSKSE